MNFFKKLLQPKATKEALFALQALKIDTGRSILQSELRHEDLVLDAWEAAIRLAREIIEEDQDMKTDVNFKVIPVRRALHAAMCGLSYMVRTSGKCASSEAQGVVTKVCVDLAMCLVAGYSLRESDVFDELLEEFDEWDEELQELEKEMGNN